MQESTAFQVLTTVKLLLSTPLEMWDFSLNAILRCKVPRRNFVCYHAFID